MGKQIAVCKFCAKRGRMRYDGYCSADCANGAAKRSRTDRGFTTEQEIARMIRDGANRRKKGRK